jgi:damage-control phosphatase, subfamily II, stand-alone protein
MTLFEGVVKLNDAIEDDAKRAENLVRGILAGNIFDLGSAKVQFEYDWIWIGVMLQVQDFVFDVVPTNCWPFNHVKTWINYKFAK